MSFEGTDTDLLAAKLAAIKARRQTASTYGDWHQVGRDLDAALAGLGAVLALHKPRTDRVLGNSCSAHRSPLPGCGTPTLLPVAGCGNCVQDRQREVCPECRDEFGDPVLFQDCRVRSAILAGLTGEGESDVR